MRSVLAVSLFALLAACDRGQSFDERYEAEANRIDSLATNMQAELDQQLNASVAAGRLTPAANGSALATNRTDEQ
jgi:hypothetical protein